MRFDVPRITRRFVRVGAREVLVRIMGSGPPAVFVHSSPANSSLVVPDMAAVADRYTCFAFDTPGFGLSDPLPDAVLPGAVLTVADLADALAATLDAVAMPPCPVFGSHTGAAIALELAARHPARVTGLVLDGLASFTAAESAALLDGYFQTFPIDPLGGHYAALWTRFRDQSTWFPWFARQPGALNESDLTPPASTNRWLTMYFDGAATYAAPYRAAITYADGPRRFATLAAPVVLTAIASDMLHPHLDRVPLTQPQHRVQRVGDSVADRRAVTGTAFDRFGSDGVAPAVAAAAVASSRGSRRFVDVAHGQLMARMAGDPAAPAVLVVHDLPGSGEAVAPLLRTLGERRFAIAFDLPGCSNSDPLAAPSVAGYAAALAAGCAALGVAPAVWGIGWGSTIAAEVAVLVGAPQLVVEGLALPEAAERAGLLARIAPEITVEPDGAHWFRTWQMLRDGEIWWPWFTPTRRALRRRPGRLDADWLHRQTCETLRQPNGHRAALHAILAHDPRPALARLHGRVVTVADSEAPVATAFAERLATLLGAPAVPRDRLASGL